MKIWAIDSNYNQIKMYKLMKHLLVILIGLSAILLSGCILIEFDPPQEFYYDVYKNSSDIGVSVVLKNANDEVVSSVFLATMEEKSLKSDVVAYNGGENPVQEYIDDLISADFVNIEIVSDGELIRKWTSNDTAINSPYNPNSWEEEAPRVLENGLERGRIIFTITNDDLVN